MLSETEKRNIATVERYFDGCRSGELEVLKSALTDDVVHYFLPKRFKPIAGAEHLARHWRKFKQMLKTSPNFGRVRAHQEELLAA